MKVLLLNVDAKDGIEPQFVGTKDAIESATFSPGLYAGNWPRYV